MIKDCHGQAGWVPALSAYTKHCRETKKPDQGIRACQQALKDHADDPYTMRLWKDLAQCCMDTGNVDQAQEATRQLRRRWSGQADYPRYLFEIAHGWDVSNRFDQAVDLFEELYQQYPDQYTPAADLKARYDKSRAMWAAQSGSDTPTLNNAITALKQNSDGPEQFKVMYQVAMCCRDMERTDQAQKLLKHITGQARKADDFRSRTYAAMASLISGEKTQGDQIMETMLGQFSDEPRLGEAVYEYGELNYDTGIHQDTDPELSQIYLRSAEQWLSRYLDDYAGDGGFRRVAQLRHARALVRLEQCGQARLEYEEWLDLYSGDPTAPFVCQLLAHCYESLFHQGLIGEEELNRLWTQLYERIIEQYPDSPQAVMAQQWLERMNSEDLEELSDAEIQQLLQECDVQGEF